MKFNIKPGTTNKRIAIFVQDSSSTTGAGLTGLLFSTSGLTWYYWREDEGNIDGTQVTLVTATRGTYASGGLIEKDSTNMPGFYEIGLPNAALITGAGWVTMVLRGATDMAPLALEIQLSSSPTDVLAIDGDTESAQDLKAAVKTIVRGTVDNTNFTPTQTQFQASNITESELNHYKDRMIIFTSGTLKDQKADIVAYSLQGGEGRFTVSITSSAPSNNDTFVIV